MDLTLPVAATEEDVSKIERQKQLRRARNIRHREKLKTLAEHKAAESFGELAAPPATPRLSGPLAVPLTPNTALTASLSELNARLKKWGYCDDRTQFLIRYDADRARARETEGGYAVWVQSQDDWVVEGDSILDGVEKLLGEGTLETLGHTDGLRVWRNVTSVVFKVQCIMAAVEVRLDCTGAIPGSI